jgi:hypothetical protein
MTHVPIDYSNYRVSPQIKASFLTNLAKSKHSHYVECIVFQYKFYKSQYTLFQDGGSRL